ncbi:MAG TPA: hypothetical protein VMK12_26715 [Anaeromyxobacteraceae bacterium]|nr:hypothetical protein [Anaeromyxobacteraceae bacterium]
MKVPVLEGPRVEGAQVQPLTSNLDFRGTNGEAIAHGVNQLAQGLSQTSSILHQAAISEAQAQTEGVVAKATADFRGGLNPIVNGFLARQGSNALDGDARDQALQQIEQVRAGILTKLPSQAARDAFQAQAGNMAVSAQDQINRHISSQREPAIAADLEASATASVNSAAQAYANPDPQALEDLKVVPLRQIDALAQLKGIDAGPMKSQFLTNFHSVVLNQYLQHDNVEGAQAYFAAHKQEMNARVQGDFEGRLLQQVHGVEAAKEASRIVLANPLKNPNGTASSWVDPVAAFNEADKLPEGQRKEEVMKALTERVSRSQALQKQGGAQAFQTLLSEWDSKHTENTPAFAQAKAYLLTPANGHTELYDRWRAQRLSDVRQARAEARADRAELEAQRREQERTDAAALTAYLAVPDSERVQVDPRQAFVGRGLSQKGIDALTAQWNASKTRVQKANTPNDDEFVKTVQGLAGQNGVRGKSNLQQLQRGMNAWRFQWAAQHNGNPPTREEVQGELSRQLQPVARKTWFGLSSEEVPRFELKDGDVIDNAPPPKPAAPTGMVEPGNIDLKHRPVVKNADGSISTVRSIGVNVGGQEVLIPTVSPDGKLLSDDDAVALYKKTGQHLGKFSSPEASTAYAQKLHESQAQLYGAQGGAAPAPAAAAGSDAQLQAMAAAALQKRGRKVTPQAVQRMLQLYQQQRQAAQ